MVTFGESKPIQQGNDANVTCEAKGKELPTFSWFVMDAGAKIKVSMVSK